MAKLLRNSSVEFSWLNNGPDGYPIRDLEPEVKGGEIIDYYGPTDPLCDYFEFCGLQICSKAFMEVVQSFSVPKVKFLKIGLQYHEKRKALLVQDSHFIFNCYTIEPILDYELSKFETRKIINGEAISRISSMVLNEELVKEHHLIQIGGGNPYIPVMVVVSEDFESECHRRRLTGLQFRNADSYP